ncbi:MAG: flavodoxin domain-containing protein [Methanomicrobiaceae archaeon]|uniref:Flavodoxin n=1 Tax=hydrocarbon metagenome TaxID=938273 RepID=A0A0W8FFI0_9ZZZZ|nr:flavodoxin domain-containing protein [Methanomicrobiaceae archaeon]MDD5419587.1 flavodoxin domain-containing protein [Methanomicrobiaceae archaeon]
MKAIVVYASRYGSTREIAEFIAGKLRQHGVQAEARSADAAPDPGDCDAVVIGSAVYMGHWMKEAMEFVRKNRAVLADRPVWLFSSGPLELGPGITSVDDPELEPEELGELREIVRPKDHKVFFGALDPGRLGFAHRALRKLPAARAILPEGDFRDWNAIEEWAGSIARALAVSAR